MIIILKPNAAPDVAQTILGQIAEAGLEPLHLPGAERVVLGALGDERLLRSLDFERHPDVESVKPILTPYKRVSREFHPPDTVVSVGKIRQIGLAPQKSKALVGLSQILLDKHGGEVPADFDALVELPGVGRKTANVVMAQAFGVPSFPVDTHILRLAHRWGLSTKKTPDGVEDDLKKLFARDRWNDAHLQIIYFGREYCPARFHDLSTCPICGWAATKKRMAEELKANNALRNRRKKS